jgi:hypothetical protein
MAHAQSSVFTRHCLATDPNNVLCFDAYVVASWLESSRPCSLRIVFTNRRPETVLLCPWAPSQGPGPPACRPTASELQTELAFSTASNYIASGRTPQKTHLLRSRSVTCSIVASLSSWRRTAWKTPLSRRGVCCAVA